MEICVSKNRNQQSKRSLKSRILQNNITQITIPTCAGDLKPKGEVKMNERKISKENRDKRFKKIALVTMIVLLMAAIGTIIGNANSFYNIRIDYVFKDGTPAHDAYIATYSEGAEVDLTVTNPNISGFTPMTEAEGGVSAATSTFQIDSIDHDVSITVYYVPGLTNYSVVYYKQNIYDDLYKRDNNVPEQYTNRYGYTGTNPTELEEENLLYILRNI